MKLNFVPGDVIQNVKKYKDEAPKMIVSFDQFGYLCSVKYPEGWDLRNRHHIFFEDAHKYYEKIGHVKVNLNVTVEE